MIISYSLSVAQPIFVFVKEEQKQSRRKRKRHDKSLAVKKKKIVVGPSLRQRQARAARPELHFRGFYLCMEP